MKKDKISVIIPVYNAEKYLENCINSIFNQNYKNYEIILVNDGSTDNSLSICEKLKKESNKVKIINQKNSGVATTRNKGLLEATGDYIIFMDNDDIISEDFFNKFLEENDNDYDIIIGGYVRETYEGKKIFERKLMNDDVAPYIQLACWGKLYKASYIKKFSFLESPIADDFYFNVLAYNSGAKIKVISYIGYHWLYNGESLSNTKNKNLKYTEDLIYVLDTIKKDVNDSSDILEYFYLRSIIYYLLFACKSVSMKKIKKSYDYMFNWLKEINKKYYKNKYIGIFKNNSEQLSVKIAIRVFIFLQKIHLIKFFLFIYSKI